MEGMEGIDHPEEHPLAPTDEKATPGAGDQAIRTTHRRGLVFIEWSPVVIEKSLVSMGNLKIIF